MDTNQVKKMMNIRGVGDESEIVLHFDGTSSSISTPVPLGTVNDE